YLAKEAEAFADIADMADRPSAERGEEIDKAGQAPALFGRVGVIFLDLLEQRRETRREIVERDFGAAPRQHGFEAQDQPGPDRVERLERSAIDAHPLTAAAGPCRPALERVQLPVELGRGGDEPLPAGDIGQLAAAGLCLDPAFLGHCSATPE